MSQRLLWDDLFPSTSSQEGFPAKTSRRQGRGRVSARKQTPPVAACGLRCSESSPKCDPLGCSLKMYLLSVCGVLTQFSLAWKQKATPAGRYWWVLGRSEPRTKGIGSGLSGDLLLGCVRVVTSNGLWSTPDSTNRERNQEGLENCQAIRKAKAGQNTVPLYLVEQVRLAENSATPKAREHQQQNSQDNYASLSKQVKNWPTAQASDANGGKGMRLNATATGKLPDGSKATISLRDSILRAGLPAQASPSTAGKPRGSLNAAWVAQLMGFPAEYTAALTRACCEYWTTHGATR